MPALLLIESGGARLVVSDPPGASALHPNRPARDGIATARRLRGATFYAPPRHPPDMVTRRRTSKWDRAKKARTDASLDRLTRVQRLTAPFTPEERRLQAKLDAELRALKSGTPRG